MSHDYVTCDYVIYDHYVIDITSLSSFIICMIIIYDTFLPNLK